MNRLVVLLFLCLLVPTTASAQLMRDHDSEGGVRGFHSLGRQTITRSFQSDNEARAEFDRILSAVGLDWITDRITLRATDATPNAEASIGKNGERLIFYNATFMQNVKQKTTDHWSLVSILAHEIGHHLAFHTEVDGRHHEFELEADYFSGFVLRRLGATLDQAHAAIRMISPKEASPTHPGLDQRLQVITVGWTNGGNAGPPPGLKTAKQSPTNLQPQTTSVETSKAPPAKQRQPDTGQAVASLEPIIVDPGKSKRFMVEIGKSVELTSRSIILAVRDPDLQRNSIGVRIKGRGSRWGVGQEFPLAPFDGGSCRLALTEVRADAAGFLLRC